MKIYIDDGIGDTWFFISVPIRDAEALSFDYTLKGHRVMKQKLVRRNQAMPEGREVTMEWDTLIFEDGKLLTKEHVQWVDLDKQDWVGGEVWETEWEKPISDELRDKLLKYSNTIRQNIDDSAVVNQKVTELEKLLQAEIDKL